MNVGIDGPWHDDDPGRLSSHSLHSAVTGTHRIRPSHAQLAMRSAAAPMSSPGFRASAIPVFEWYGLAWLGSSEPPTYVPIFSDLDEVQVVALVQRAREGQSLRALAEAASMVDPIVADFLYILDQSAGLDPQLLEHDWQEFQSGLAVHSKSRPLLLNGWQSYGRSSVLALEETAECVPASREIAAVLPCARRRPYDHSRTHRRIYALLEEHGYHLDQIHLIVITALGVLPREVWNDPRVLGYDAGVPDIYRTLRLVRSYFGRRPYRLVIDCLQFEPYRDVLRITQREGRIRADAPPTSGQQNVLRASPRRRYGPVRFICRCPCPA